MWQRSHESCSEEMKLELRLGPPGEEFLNEKNVKKEKDEASSFLQLSSMPLMAKDEEKNAFLPSSTNSAVHNSSQKRSASGPVVGWPPIRSFRKNIASGSSSNSKPPTGSQQDKVAYKVVRSNKTIGNTINKGLFVKVIMDGVPIGRKVDINAYDSYEKLSSAVDKLFIDLLQELNLCHIVYSHSGGGTEKKEEGSLIGSGEYSLVYEANDGDRMLVGDVPWKIFVSTKVKRLRVLKTSDLPAFKKLDEAV